MNVLLTGTPGCGKTTLIRRLAGCVAGARGFFTAEIRDANRRRVGFSIETLDGKVGRLAHVDCRSPVRVGRYGVDVRGFEAVALPVLCEPLRAGELIVIDEIGKMECFSGRFVAAVQRALDSPADVVATVALRGGGFIEQVKRRGDVELLHVTRRSADELLGRLLERFRSGR